MLYFNVKSVIMYFSLYDKKEKGSFAQLSAILNYALLLLLKVTRSRNSL